MVNEFLKTIKNSNHLEHGQPHQQHQNQLRSGTGSFKSNKQYEKSKRSFFKIDSKKMITDLVKDPDPSTSKANNSYTSLKTKAPIKVKSGSWKRSEKQKSGYNPLSNKKSKSLRKKSPTWYKFPNNMTVKLNNTNSASIKTSGQTSVCRPGTLYSDVLFGAGSSNLIKVKNLTPRHSNNTAQKKLTKALFKYTGDDHDDPSDESEIETQRNIFPTLEKLNNKTSAATSTNSPLINSLSLDTISICESLDGTTTSLGEEPSKCDDSYKEADVIILQSQENEVSYGNYLDKHFEESQDNSEASTSHHNSSNNSSSNFSKSSGSPTKHFSIDIPKWNFIEPDISLEGFPKFLCQFNDENYLKAEKMALLGLKLALGNNSQRKNFKFP